MRATESDREELLKHFGAYIREIRIAKGVKTTELASWCDTGKGSISRLEAGRVNPSLYFLFKLSEALEIPIGELLKDFKPEKE